MDEPPGSSEKEAKPNARDNPQLIRLKSLTKKTKPKTKTPRSKRRPFPPFPQRSPLSAEKKEPRMYLSDERSDENVSSGSQVSAKEGKSPETIRGHLEKTNKRNGDDELERRLEKLNKILQELKEYKKFQEDKIRRIRESVKTWEEKYEKRLTELESSMRRFAERCQVDKAELNDQISRVEEMSDTNVAMRQRIEKKLVVHGPTIHSESNQKLLTMTLNLVRGMLYYAAQIRDNWYPQAPSTSKIDAVPDSSKEVDEDEANDEKRTSVVKNKAAST